MRWVDTATRICIMGTMETTLVVTVTLKVNAKGNTPNELVSNALDTALDAADSLIGSTWDDGVPGMSVEGANVLVNRAALDSAFNIV
jgi:hypothetical protein